MITSGRDFSLGLNKESVMIEDTFYLIPIKDNILYERGIRYKANQSLHCAGLDCEGYSNLLWNQKGVLQPYCSLICFNTIRLSLLKKYNLSEEGKRRRKCLSL